MVKETQEPPVRGAAPPDPKTVGLARELFAEFGVMQARMSRNEGRAVSGEMAVMRALVLAGGSLTPSALADRAWVSSARVANICRSLEEKGWISREHSSEDRRRVTVSVTEAGRAWMEGRRRRLDEVTCDFLSELGEADSRELLRLMRRVTELVDERQSTGRGIFG